MGVAQAHAPLWSTEARKLIKCHEAHSPASFKTSDKLECAQQVHWGSGKFLRIRCQEHIEHSLSPSANSDYTLENEFSKITTWKGAGFRPVLSPKENLIWTFYTERRMAGKPHSARSKPPWAIPAQSRASPPPTRHPGLPPKKASSSLLEGSSKGWTTTSGQDWWN